MGAIARVHSDPKYAQIYNHTTSAPQQTRGERGKRTAGLLTAWVITLIRSLVALVGGAIYDTVAIKEVTATVVMLADEEGLDFKILQNSIDCLAKMVLDNRTALDHLLADQGGVCALANTSCCFLY